MLENAYLIVKIGVNTEENELNVAEILPIAGGVPRRWPRGPARVRGVVGRVCEGGPFPPSPEHSANGIPQTLDGPFSAVPEADLRNQIRIHVATVFTISQIDTQLLHRSTVCFLLVSFFSRAADE